MSDYIRIEAIKNRIDGTLREMDPKTWQTEDLKNAAIAIKELTEALNNLLSYSPPVQQLPTMFEE